MDLASVSALFFFILCFLIYYFLPSNSLPASGIDSAYLFNRFMILKKIGLLINRIRRIFAEDGTWTEFFERLRQTEERYDLNCEVFDHDGHCHSYVEYSSNVGQNAPTLIYFHGGGWCKGSISTVHNFCSALSSRLRCRVISSDYPLAPEKTFPAGINFGIAFVKHMISICPDQQQLYIAGDSAGGNISAVVMQQLCAEGDGGLASRVSGVILITPCVQLFNFATPTAKSVDAMLTGFLDLFCMTYIYGEDWKRSDVRLIESLIGEDLSPFSDLESLLIGLDERKGLCRGYFDRVKDLKASPLLASSEYFHLHPPCLIVGFEFDEIYEDSVAYYEKLKREGVKVDFVSLNGIHVASHLVFRGFAFPSGFEAMNRIDEWFKRRNHDFIDNLLADCTD